MVSRRCSRQCFIWDLPGPDMPARWLRKGRTALTNQSRNPAISDGSPKLFLVVAVVIAAVAVIAVVVAIAAVAVIAVVEVIAGMEVTAGTEGMAILTTAMATVTDSRFLVP